jgi:hypothetical protein
MTVSVEVGAVKVGSPIVTVFVPAVLSLQADDRVATVLVRAVMKHGWVMPVPATFRPMSDTWNLAAVEVIVVPPPPKVPSLKVRVVEIPTVVVPAPSCVAPNVTVWARCGETPVTVAQAGMLAVVAVRTVSVAGAAQAESSMNVPPTLRPLSAAVKFAVAEVMFGAAASTVASTTDRVFEFSTR